MFEGKKLRALNLTDRDRARLVEPVLRRRKKKTLIMDAKLLKKSYIFPHGLHCYINIDIIPL